MLITSATPVVIGMNEKQFVDVGIVEERAVVLASGIAIKWRETSL